MIGISKKGQGSNMDILIILIVGLVALALLLGIIFRADLLNWVRNLPDYGNPEEDRVIDIGNDEIVNNVKICEKVGELVPIKREKGFTNGAYYFTKSIFSENEQYYISIQGKKTELYLYQYDSKKEVLVIELDERNNENIGQISNGKVLIEDKWFNDEIIRIKHPKLPSADSLKLIDEGYLGGMGGNSICKKTELKK